MTETRVLLFLPRSWFHVYLDSSTKPASPSDLGFCLNYTRSWICHGLNKGGLDYSPGIYAVQTMWGRRNKDDTACYLKDKGLYQDSNNMLIIHTFGRLFQKNLNLFTQPYININGVQFNLRIEPTAIWITNCNFIARALLVLTVPSH